MITSSVSYMVGSQLRVDHFCDYGNHLIDATHMTQAWEVLGGPKGRVMVHMDFVKTGPHA